MKLLGFMLWRERWLCAILIIALVMLAVFSVIPSTHASSEVAGPHISWSHSFVNGPTFSNSLRGHNFPADDVDDLKVAIDYTVDGELGGVCEHVTSGPLHINIDGTFSLLVTFTNCQGHNNIMATVVDDRHTNHAFFHIN